MSDERWHNKGTVRRYSRWKMIGARLFPPSFPQEIVKAVGSLEQEATVVDLGAGPGLLAIELHKLWPHVSFICVDPSEEMLKIAERNAAAAGLLNFETRLGSAEAIPIDSDSVDVVVSQSSLHEWEDPEIGLSEIYRILKHGGRLVLEDYNGNWLSNWKQRILGRFHHLDMFKFVVEEIVGMLKEVGFVDVHGRERGLKFLVQAAKR